MPADQLNTNPISVQGSGAKAAELCGNLLYCIKEDQVKFSVIHSISQSTSLFPSGPLPLVYRTLQQTLQFAGGLL